MDTFLLWLSVFYSHSDYNQNTSTICASFKILIRSYNIVHVSSFITMNSTIFSLKEGRKNIQLSCNKNRAKSNQRKKKKYSPFATFLRIPKPFLHEKFHNFKPRNHEKRKRARQNLLQPVTRNRAYPKMLESINRFQNGAKISRHRGGCEAKTATA